MNRPLSETTRYFTDPVYRAEVDADYLRRRADLMNRVTFPAAHHAIPAEERVERVMRDMGFGRMQAINHLRQRDALADKLRGELVMPWPWIGGFVLGIAFCALVAGGLLIAHHITRDDSDDDGFWEQW